MTMRKGTKVYSVDDPAEIGTVHLVECDTAWVFWPGFGRWEDGLFIPESLPASVDLLRSVKR